MLRASDPRAPVASVPQDSGLAGAEVIPCVSIQMDMGEDQEQTLSFDVGPGAQPIQPPHPQLGTLSSDISTVVGTDLARIRFPSIQ